VNDKHPVEATEEVLATPQMSMKAGLRLFGEDSVMVVKNEMNPLHERKVIMAPCL
jgi:hypothetical protein